jgi:hypothetical protein
MSDIEQTEISQGSGRRLARLVFFTFVITFVAARVFVFFVMLADSLRYVGKTLEPRLAQIEQKGPK